MKLTKVIYYLGIGVVAFFALLLTFSAFPIPGNYRVLTVLSGSMEPKIKVGSLTVVKPATNYTIDDIITYKDSKDPTKFTTHRIVGENTENNQTNYITQGDANNAPDSEPVTSQNVIGKVFFTLPYLGYAANAVKQPVGFFILIILPATLIIYDEIRKIKKEVVKLRQKKTLLFLFLFSSSLTFIGATTAFISDTETSTGNTFSAANSFGETANLYQSNGFTCDGGATNQEAQFGSVTIDIGTNNIFLNVTLAGATPNSSYDIWVNQDPGGCPQSSPTFSGGDAMQTDGNGNANRYYTVAKVQSATKFWISAVGGVQVLRSIAVE